MPLHDVSAASDVQSTIRLISGNLSTSSHSFVDATGLTLTVVTGGHRCLVVFSGFGANNTVGQDVALDLSIDGSRQGGTFGLTAQGGSGDANLSFSFLTDVLSAGSHTIKVVWYATGSSSATLFSSATAPATLSVIELL